MKRRQNIRHPDLDGPTLATFRDEPGGRRWLEFNAPEYRRLWGYRSR